MVKNKVKAIDMKAIRSLYPFTSHYQRIGGHGYHYVDEGKGEPMMMIHGNPTWSFFFRELIKGLKNNYRTIAPDHIGCGLSEKPGADRYPYNLERRVDDLEIFITKLDLKQKLTLIVHDWGGMIGMAYALRHTENIGRLVIMNTAAFLPPSNKPIPLRLQMIRNIRPFAESAVLGLNLFARAAVYMAPKKKLTGKVKQGLLAPYNSRQNRIATLKFVQDIPLTEKDPSYQIVKQADDRLHQLSKIPMLILWGRHDFVFDMDYFREWQRRFPNATTRVFDDAGHYLLEDVPHKILAKINVFLTENPLKPNS